MPIDIIRTVIASGTESLSWWPQLVRYGPVVLAVGGLKYYFTGTHNTWERDMNGRVFIVTGGTSGVGAAIVKELAKKGAQLILLSSQVDRTQWFVDYINDLREETNNILIYGEQCDLSSLYSVRKFATTWLDNVPPRRLDGVICCAGESIPPGTARSVSKDGIESQIAVNYLSHFHLLTLLSPALRAQPADRDVRVIVTSCVTQSLGEIDLEDPLWQTKKYPQNRPWNVFGTSKLMLSMFAKEYQRRLEAVPRKDNAPCNIRVNVVNPGIMRSPSTRRVLSLGSIWGLFIYLLTYPIWFVLLKPTEAGAQSFLYALSAPVLAELKGGNYIQECHITQPARKELDDQQLQVKLYEKTEACIAQIERKSASAKKRV
ncbi:unnamed protein product [Kuraishia capsulata CBS 1993]|uniref:Ketoreductase (KR) domain-containing protein n=1 Tax=Kuraishia capsulata CBS 1993 TaxID=1382522 RepID=W6MQ25_9ASCO|nr:uncharacterized protein KUCA_T00004814001 [Kuraishia capsulata CBS 1993]CDK28829.1 unnamed protein product [Kuraishia capsulata CBS 1993]